MEIFNKCASVLFIEEFADRIDSENPVAIEVVGHTRVIAFLPFVVGMTHTLSSGANK